jgi:hypothetical protein
MMMEAASTGVEAVEVSREEAEAGGEEDGLFPRATSRGQSHIRSCNTALTM